MPRPDTHAGRVAHHAAAYDAAAESYEREGERSGRPWFQRPLTELQARLPSSGRVLDLGCGPGLESADLHDRGLLPVGVDGSRGMLQRTAKRCPQGDFVHGDMLSLPLANEAVDGVWASASLFHLAREDVGRALAEIHRVLRPGGAFYSSVSRGAGAGWVPGDHAAEVFYTNYAEAEWAERLRAAGFTIVALRVETESVNRNRGATGWLNTLALRPAATP